MSPPPYNTAPLPEMQPPLVVPPPPKPDWKCEKKPPPIPPNQPKCDCEYYIKRANNFQQRHVNCGHRVPNYYAGGPPVVPEKEEGYGWKYCKRFGRETRPILSEKGKTWLDKVRCNLQLAIEDGLKANPDVEMNPWRFGKMAFDSHPKAYWDAGMKELPVTDLYRVGITPDLAEWARWRTWNQAFSVGGRFMLEPGELVRLGKEGLVTAGEAATGYIKQVSSDLRGFFRSLF